MIHVFQLIKYYRIHQATILIVLKIFTQIYNINQYKLCFKYLHKSAIYINTNSHLF
jgi:hypothetical protein